MLRLQLRVPLVSSFFLFEENSCSSVRVHISNRRIWDSQTFAFLQLWNQSLVCADWTRRSHVSASEPIAEGHG